MFVKFFLFKKAFQAYYWTMFSSESPQYLRQGLSMFGQSLLLNVSEFVFPYRRKNELFCSRNKVFVCHGYVVVTASQHNCMNILFLNHIILKWLFGAKYCLINISLEQYMLMNLLYSWHPDFFFVMYGTRKATFFFTLITFKYLL